MGRRYAQDWSLLLGWRSCFHKDRQRKAFYRSICLAFFWSDRAEESYCGFGGVDRKGKEEQNTLQSKAYPLRRALHSRITALIIEVVQRCSDWERTDHKAQPISLTAKHGNPNRVIIVAGESETSTRRLQVGRDRFLTLRADSCPFSLAQELRREGGDAGVGVRVGPAGREEVV